MKPKNSILITTMKHFWSKLKIAITMRELPLMILVLTRINLIKLKNQLLKYINLYIVLRYQVTNIWREGTQVLEIKKIHKIHFSLYKIFKSKISRIRNNILQQRIWNFQEISKFQSLTLKKEWRKKMMNWNFKSTMIQEKERIKVQLILSSIWWEKAWISSTRYLTINIYLDSQS